MITWQEKTVAVSDLRPYERNPRRITESAYKRLKASLAEYRYHKVNTPIPTGWELAHDLQDSHHGRYSVLIKRIKPI